ncbi:tudor domain-containing protein 7B [Gouania willdenowi]|uniref:Tudor domain-containing protein 7B-like n=1 Tax=Gouania willdenowi TaxID=441366 RepID=A0A8C5HB89_GOUWI|nr:tudor domain-containing protein 7B-like [Gouania willdenowi]
MADNDVVKNMLGVILQANHGGMSLSHLQRDYKELTGEQIPHMMGHKHLDGMPVDRSHSGEMDYFASGDRDTRHLAKVVARQRGSKKTGRTQFVNTQMRVKPVAPLVFDARPQSSLRQPNYQGRGRGRGGVGGAAGRGSGHGDFRQARDMRNGQPEGKTWGQSNTTSNQNTQNRKGNVPADKPEKRMTLPAHFQKEVQAHLSRNSPYTFFSQSEGLASGKGEPYNAEQVQAHIKEILVKYSNGIWVSKLPRIYRDLYKEDLPVEAIKDLETWTHICIVEKTYGSNASELLLYPTRASSNTSSPLTSHNTTASNTRKPLQSSGKKKPSGSSLSHSGSQSPQSSSSSSSSPIPPSSPATLSSDLKKKLEELLVKYPNGLWAHALPKLFQDTYNTKLPGHVLEKLDLLSELCIIDYPMPDNPKRAILYKRSCAEGVEKDENCNRRNSSTSEEERTQKKEVKRRPSVQEVSSLHIPKEESSNVLVLEATNTNQVMIRYIGEGYSQALESMDDEMREFYGLEESRQVSSSALCIGKVVAVRVEDEDAILRAQVSEVMSDELKVKYVDHGFSAVISKSKVFELQEKFLKLPFQATKCKLAGLEPFSQVPAVISKFETMTSGRILLAEILERGPTPLVVLYDMSQDDDVNINAVCMRELQDKTLACPLQVNSVYMNVIVTSVCSDGTICCQLPSKGFARMNEILEKIEKYFHSQVTSEFLVSRPFCGKVCLARFKGKWSRVEITNLHGSRVLDIRFIDVGVQASVEVFELREIPTTFLCDLMAIPPQGVKCCLADLCVSVGCWTADAVQWLREKVVNTTDCSMKVTHVDETKGCIYIHLFTSKTLHDPSRSLNHQMAQTDLFKQQPDVVLTSQSLAKISTASFSSITSSTSDSIEGSPFSSSGPVKADLKKTLLGSETPSPFLPSPQPPPLLELPPAGSNMDVFVSVACHPGHFVLQPWRDTYKLVVMMEEMILYYNKTEEKPLNIAKNQIHAAKVENNWHRVLVKGVLTNGMVSVYELDYGKHELVSCTQIRPLIKEFRQLPFQGLTAQLAGMKPKQWSEEASIVFRNHVEKKALVAQLEAVEEGANSWDRKLTVFLVDTSQEEKDVWVHDIMAEFVDELSNEP